MSTPSIVQSNADHDVVWSARTIPMSRRRHVCGLVPWTPPQQALNVESDLEARALVYLMRASGLVALHSQPFTLTYRDGSAKHRYTPDFLVVFSRPPRSLVQLGFARWTVVEVKAQSMLDLEADLVARRLRATHELLGFATVVLTDRQIPPRRTH